MITCKINCQAANFLRRPTLFLINSRCSSNLPKKSDQHHELKPRTYNFPITPKEPVAHAELKLINQEYHGVKPVQFQDDLNWYPIFRFPHTLRCMMAIRFKAYLTIFSMCATTKLVYDFILNPKLGLFTTALLSSTTVVGLILLGNFARKFVCLIYTTDNGEFIRISRFTFFGKRLDMILPTESILPISENNKSFMIPLLEIETIKPNKLIEGDMEEFYDEVYRFTLRYGGVTDKERFEKVLGKILSRGNQ